jgi:signal transduction histidine kinase
MLRKSGIEVKASFPEGLPLCYVDPQLLEQVVLNLITNAVQAMEGVESGKRIEVSTSLDEDAVAIAIADSGPGVPPHLRQKIFDPFYTTKSGSTGIGLSLSHRIIQDHGGTLSVSASRLGGAEFVIRLPIPKER